MVTKEIHTAAVIRKHQSNRLKVGAMDTSDLRRKKTEKRVFVLEAIKQPKSEELSKNHTGKILKNRPTCPVVILIMIRTIRKDC